MRLIIILIGLAAATLSGCGPLLVGAGGAVIADPPWMPGQPSGDSDQNCALFVPSAGGAWNDATCTDAHPVRCRL